MSDKVATAQDRSGGFRIRGGPYGGAVQPLDRSLDDAWFTRDLPVLRAIARLVDGPQHGGAPYLGQVVPATGLPQADVTAAARALVSAGYVGALTNYAGGIVRFTRISAGARRPARLWAAPPGGWGR